MLFCAVQVGFQTSLNCAYLDVFLSAMHNVSMDLFAKCVCCLLCVHTFLLAFNEYASDDFSVSVC